MPDKTIERDSRWDALTAPFPQDWIERLPKTLSRDDQNKGRCENTPRGSQYSADGHYCGGWHSRAVHLDYVGHAGITMRLNDAVGPENWSWEPYVNTPEGLPGWKRDEFWIKLTILGVSKIGVGDDSSSPKVLIGDALRNAAMRFGVGTYLWSKSDIAGALAAYSEPDPQTPEGEAASAGTSPSGQDSGAEGAPNAAGGPPVEQTSASEPPDPADDYAPPEAQPLTARTRGQLFVLFGKKGVSEEEQLPGVNHICGTNYTSRTAITEADAKRVIAVLKKRPDVVFPSPEEKP